MSILRVALGLLLLIVCLGVCNRSDNKRATQRFARSQPIVKRSVPRAQSTAELPPADESDFSDTELIEPADVDILLTPHTPPMPDVTLNEYMSLNIGISYLKAAELIGTMGKEVSRNHIDGAPGVMDSVDTVMYMWQNEDGSNMNAMFQNDNLMQKSQFGLK